MDIAEVLHVPLYSSLDELADAVPLSENEMAMDRFRDISSSEKAAVRQVLIKWGMGNFITSSLIEISDNPFKAQLEVMGAIAAVLTQTAHNDEITVLIPDVESWDGLRVDGVTIEGRLWKDLKRVVDPYLDTLLARAKCKVHIRHAAG